MLHRPNYFSYLLNRIPYIQYYTIHHTALSLIRRALSNRTALRLSKLSRPHILSTHTAPSLSRLPHNTPASATFLYIMHHPKSPPPPDIYSAKHKYSPFPLSLRIRSHSSQLLPIPPCKKQPRRQYYILPQLRPTLVSGGGRQSGAAGDEMVGREIATGWEISDKRDGRYEEGVQHRRRKGEAGALRSRTRPYHHKSNDMKEQMVRISVSSPQPGQRALMRKNNRWSSQ